MREPTQGPTPYPLVVWQVLICVPILFFLGIYQPLFAVSSGHNDPFDDTSQYAVKTLLNRGGLGWPYDEGEPCLVDLWATFTPLGIFEGLPVARYTRRLAWWSFKQCPTGSLVRMDMSTLAAWQDARHEEHVAAQRKTMELEALTNAAKAR